MGGGLLQLVATGTQDAILTGNPKKSFFKCAYRQYTNFSLQKFRLDFEGQTALRRDEASTFRFKIPRYGDLLVDSCLVFKLPGIWSSWFDMRYAGPGEWPEGGSGDPFMTPIDNAYEFRWIKDIGSQMIDRVRYIIGGQVVQEYSGQYLKNAIARDFSAGKRQVFDEMTGNVPELYDPAQALAGGLCYRGTMGAGSTMDMTWVGLHNGDNHTWYSGGAAPAPVPTAQYGHGYTLSRPAYPTAADLPYADGRGADPKLPTGPFPAPSIRGRTLYVPVGLSMGSAPSASIPLVSLQYAQLEVEITIRPISELFVIRAPPPAPFASKDYNGSGPCVGDYTAPDFSIDSHGLYRFLQPREAAGPYKVSVDPCQEKMYRNESLNTWDADAHLISTYAFLTKAEVDAFAKGTQEYLIREVHESSFQDVGGDLRRIELASANGLIANWMWFVQRSDVPLRNQWSNYTNQPYDSCAALGWYDRDEAQVRPANINQLLLGAVCVPGLSGAGHSSGPRLAFSAGQVMVTDERDIVRSWGTIFDGKWRETTFDAGIVRYMEKFTDSNGAAPPGVCCYNFCLNTGRDTCQPSGAVNASLFSKIQFEMSTADRPVDVNAQTTTICDGATGETVGVNKATWDIFEYAFNMHLMEERYNLLVFKSGMASLKFAR